MMTSLPLTCDSDLSSLHLPDPIQSDSFGFFFLNQIWKFKKKKNAETGCDQWEKKNVVFILFSFICNVPKINKKLWNNFLFYLHEPRSSQATELRSWPKIISRSKPLSHWVMIWPSQAEIYFKSQSEAPSSWAETQAKSSWAVFWVLFCYRTHGFIKITPWVWGGMLRNKFHCIPHCLNVSIIIYSFPINRTSHKYCKHTERISIKM